MELLTECCNRLREPICAQARWLGANRESSLPSRCLHGRAGARRRRGPKSRLAAIPAAGIADCPTTRPGRRPLRPDDRTDSGSGSHSRRAPVCARRKLRLRQPARMPGRARHALGRGRHACRSRQLRTIRARNLGREPRVRLRTLLACPTELPPGQRRPPGCRSNAVLLEDGSHGAGLIGVATQRSEEVLPVVDRGPRAGIPRHSMRFMGGAVCRTLQHREGAV